MKKNPFINIHAHSVNEDDVFTLLNIDVEDFFLSKHCEAFSLGIHPWKAAESNDELLLNFNKRLSSEKKIWAVGECGLDKFAPFSMEHQQKLFELQIKASEKHCKPLIVHCVKAFSELIGLKLNYQPKQAWIVHGFNRKRELARSLINHGFFLSFGNDLLHKTYLQNAFLETPLERIFFESDNSDVSVKELYVFASNLKKIEVEEMKRQLNVNFLTCFNAHGLVE